MTTVERIFYGLGLLWCGELLAGVFAVALRKFKQDTWYFVCHLCKTSSREYRFKFAMQFQYWRHFRKLHTTEARR